MKYLGVDYGLKKVGLAMSLGLKTSPFKILEVSSLDDAVAQVMEVVKKESVDLAVVGMPEGGRAARMTRRFVKELGKFVKVFQADETLSTRQASTLMVEMGFGRKARKKEDAMSAALILQEFLDKNTLCKGKIR